MEGSVNTDAWGRDQMCRTVVCRAVAPNARGPPFPLLGNHSEARNFRWRPTGREGSRQLTQSGERPKRMEDRRSSGQRMRVQVFVRTPLSRSDTRASAIKAG